MPQNMSFWSNREDRVLRCEKLRRDFVLANLYVNGTSSASFATTFMQ
jgi:hypothetical protein